MKYVIQKFKTVQLLLIVRVFVFLFENRFVIYFFEPFSRIST
jgi:hypothetical protein